MLPPFPRKPLTELVESDLQQLIEDAIPEGLEIDYKTDVGVGSLEFAKDVSAFANSKGGYLVFGMTEENQRPTSLKALPDFHSDIEIGRMTAWAQEHVRPRLNLRFQSVQIASGGEVLVVEILKSWQGPHEVKQEHRYYRRNQHGKGLMDVDELREAFGLENGFTKSVEDIQSRRIAHWFDRATGLGSTTAIFLLHLVPADGVMTRHRIDFSGTECDGYFPVPHPSLSGRVVWRGSTTFSHNLEGYEFRQIVGRAGETDTCQIFRNGSFEYKFVSFDSGGDRTFKTILVDQWLVNALKHAQRAMQHLEIQGPVAVAGALLGAQDWEWPLPNLEGVPFKIQDQRILFPDIILESVDSDPEPIVESLSNLIWNAMGRSGSPNFRDGKYQPYGALAI